MLKDVFKAAEEKMNKSLEVLDKNYREIRAGRANPAVLDKITVSYYGADTPVSQVAAISVTEARTLLIQPWDPSICRAIEKAIQTSDLGINPQSDGKVIRLTFPPLNEERRRALTKDVSKMAEESKVAIRSIRRDALEKVKAMKKAGEATEDEAKSAEKTAQDLTDKYCQEVDKLSAAKEKDLMEI